MRQAAAEARNTAASEHSSEADEQTRQRSADSPVALAMTFDELLGSDNAPDETAEDIIRAVRMWRDTPDGKRRN